MPARPVPLSPPAVGRVQRYELLGTAAVVEVDSVEVATGVAHLLRPFRRPRPTSDDGQSHECRYSLTAGAGGWILGIPTTDGERRERDRSWPPLVGLLLADLNQRALTGFQGLAVHAGVVARHGDVIAFPAASGVGKSTLTAACLAEGFGYVSDEALCLDFATTAVVPYPRPLMLSRPSLDLAGQVGPVGVGLGADEVAVTAGDLGARPARGQLRLAHVVQLHRRPGPAEMFPLDRARGLAALLSLSFNHYRHPGQCFSLATRLARSAHVWELDYDDPPTAARLLFSLSR